MKHLSVGIALMFLLSCKSSSQVILIKSDGGLISENDLTHSSLRVTLPLTATKEKDTIVEGIDMPKLLIELQKLGVLTDNSTPTTQTYPNFQKGVAIEGQTFFPFILPKVYIVFKNRVLMDLITDYTISPTGITFLAPTKANDVVRLINLEAK